MYTAQEKCAIGFVVVFIISEIMSYIMLGNDFQEITIHLDHNLYAEMNADKIPEHGIVIKDYTTCSYHDENLFQFLRMVCG